jgi:hypothetical protein
MLRLTILVAIDRALATFTDQELGCAFAAFLPTTTTTSGGFFPTPVADTGHGPPSVHPRDRVRPRIPVQGQVSRDLGAVRSFG